MVRYFDISRHLRYLLLFCAAYVAFFFVWFCFSFGFVFGFVLLITFPLVRTTGDVHGTCGPERLVVPSLPSHVGGGRHRRRQLQRR